MYKHQPRRPYHVKRDVLPVAVPTRSPSTLRVVIVKVNVMRPVCSMMFGHGHSTVTRLFAGLVVMAIGVTIAKYFGHSHSDVVAYAGDGIGYGLHGLGATPFIEWVVKTFEDAT